MDLVFPWKTPYQLTKSEHTYVRPFYVRTPEEEIRVTVNKIDYHFSKDYPYFLNL